MCTTEAAADPSSQIKELIHALEARAADLPKPVLGQALVEIRGLIQGGNHHRQRAAGQDRGPF